MKVIPLPTSGDDLKPGTTCRVAGWGQTMNYMKKLSDTLREVNVTVISRKTCNDKKHYKNNPRITNNMICAGSKRGQKDSCQVSSFYKHGIFLSRVQEGIIPERSEFTRVSSSNP